ncbi:MAG: polysaccharide biosynthesis tyrosine autokinase [Bacteroidales bacterium]|jgi:capsular exopolysaccharide synthesis family protein|nr:polysaccharide biosynthesis tyrosine autokinase [Bacteroidales bacterium]
MAKQKNIPVLNESFDLSKFLLVVRKNILYYVFILALCAAGAFLYLRYTLPTYQAYAVIQINDEQNNDFLNTENLYGKSTLPNTIELLRSQEFLKRILTKLNLYTGYYAQGNFLSTEFYRNAPFFVELEETQSNFLNQPVFVSINENTKKIELSYSLDGHHTITTTIERNTWQQIAGTKIYVNIINEQAFFEPTNDFYFIRYDDETAFKTYIDNNLQIAILNSTANTIQISYSGYNAQKTADIVNAISEMFLIYEVEKKQERAVKVLEFIEEQLKIVYEKLSESEQELANFKKAHNITATSPLLNKSLIFDDKTRQEIDNYQAQLSSLQRLTKELNTNNTLNTSELTALLAGSNAETLLLNFLNSIGQLQKQRSELLMTVTPENQKIKIIDKQIAEQRELLQQFIQNNNRQLREKLASLNALTKSGEISFDETEFTKLSRIHAINQNYYNELIAKRAEYLILKAGNISNSVILQYATVPKSPISPIFSNVVLTALFIALMLIALLTFVRYILFNEITSLKDITQFTDVPISGLIPTTPKVDKIHRFTIENKSNSVITEAFRTLRSNLEFIQQTDTYPKVIAVSSTIPAEGKTFIAVNLGGVISFNHKRVILLDMDLRKPKVHLSFKLSNKKGLSTILIGLDNYKDCIEKTELENFDILTSGPPPPNPAELANSNHFDQLLADLKKEYDVIIIDTPPIGIVSDAIFSFKRADLPIYVVRANVSKRNFLNNVNYIKNKNNIDNLSIVLNAIEVISARYGYNYQGYGYSQYGYGYGYGFGYGYYSYNSDAKSKKKQTRLFKDSTE